MDTTPLSATSPQPIQAHNRTRAVVSTDSSKRAHKRGELQFTSRPAVVAEKLREAIIAGVLKPGERLVEQKLATKFGIGQPTLREALKELEFQGMVRKSVNRGTYVTELTPEEFSEILEVRMALELVAVGRAAKNMDRAAERRLQELVETMESASHNGDLVTFQTSDLHFHKVIWGLSGNRHLMASLERLAYSLFAYELLQRNSDTPEQFMQAADHHRQILDGLRSGDPSVASSTFAATTKEFRSRYNGVRLVNVPDGSGAVPD